MSSSEQQSDAGGGGPPRRALGVGLVAALAVALVIAAVWLMRNREAQDTGGQTTLVAPGGGAEGEAHFAAQIPAPHEGTTDSTPAVPAVPAAPVAPLDPSTANGWHDVRGVVLRASDNSPIASATVVALPQASDSGGAADELSMRTGRDGGFTLRVPPGAVNFRVTLPESAQPRDAAWPNSRVEARIEWANGDPMSSDLRIVMESGWRLDAQLIDGVGRPRAGVVVKGGGRSAKSDVDGRCVLLDLPLGDQPIDLTLQIGGGKEVTYPVDAPEPGSLRKEVKLTVP